MQDIHWDDYRVAYQVALAGSLSKAAQQLHCNHATVLRHVNRLEMALNIKLFIRHQRGYKLTDAGQIMVSEMPNIYEEFNRLESLMGSVEQDISGNLRITTLVEYAALLNPVLVQFRSVYPNLRIQLISTDEVIALSSGAAHVSLRAGPEPKDPDLIARKLLSIDMAYYAADSYVKKHGLPKTKTELNHHDWLMPSTEKQHLPFIKDMLKIIDRERIVYQSNHFIDIESAVSAGIGIGLISTINAEKHNNLQQVTFTQLNDVDMGNLWFVYHRDLKHNAKVKTLYQYLFEYWQNEPLPVST